MTETMGRRERKKAQTRQALADAALALFTEKGFDNVGVREIAQAADVALSTLFQHFPSKEALVFDMDADLEADMVAAVRDRPAGQSVLHALRDHLTAREQRRGDDDDPSHTAHAALVNSTPALREYARGMWLRHQDALTAAIAQAAGVPRDNLAATALARFALECPSLARSDQDLRQLFDLLEHGWGGWLTTSSPSQGEAKQPGQ
ncbi:TetR/AcrR family transcriptional regulator [Nonomuraea jabiensis]|uniref:AcrR family transcriptional regulator n=1 Tax=Nonomuraea jabiensis TaxID=882448 RepID=A0A7W9LBA5_9ACTN|nr:TetR/AcrR family transcriptional regulator [Nonomuraea jabiensis]MBB5777446.1 AcrR family transcriptional regulator [Nonomuraea jabiensis]